MKYDMPSFRLDKKDFFLGNNSYADYQDGGFLTATVGVNVFSKPGLFTQAPAFGSTVTSSLGQRGVIAWATGYGSGAPSTVALVNPGSQQAQWYSVNATTGGFTSIRSADGTGGRTYDIGLSDMIFYNSKIYTSVMGDIVEMNIDGSGSDLTWWTGTKAKAAMTTTVPHPMLVYESMHYIADGKYLHRNDAGTITTQAFDLPPNFVITSMIEWNGLIYVVAEPYLNGDGAIHGGAMMFSWNGLSDSWFEQYFINYRVNAMYVYKNRLFMWTNQFMGQWDGAKIVPLKKVSAQVFKCHITETSDSLLYADGTNIVRFGAPFIPGAPERFYSYLNSPLGYVWTGIISLQNNNLVAVENGIAISECKNYYLSNINTPASSGFRIFNFNPRFFNKPVKVRRVVVDMEALTNAIIYPFYVDDKGNEKQASYKSGIITSADSAMAGRTYFDFDYGALADTRSVQPRIYIFNAPHIRSIDYFYEPVEQRVHD